jgi:hypothetical protein
MSKGTDTKTWTSSYINPRGTYGVGCTPGPLEALHILDSRDLCPGV